MANRWLYSLVMLLSLVTTTWLLKRFQLKLPLSPAKKAILMAAAFVGAMLSAKLPFLFGHLLNQSVDAPWDESQDGDWIGQAWLADGKTIMMGLAGGYLAVELAKWLLSIRIRTGDSFAVPVAVGVALGRLGCFIAGCCYGKVSSAPWAVHFSVVDTNASVFRHPTQLFEFAFHAAAALGLLVAYRKLHAERSAVPPLRPSWFELAFLGNLLKAYLLLYLVFRLLSEELRPEPEFWWGLTIYQLAALVLIPIFGGLWMADVLLRLSRIGSRKTGSDDLSEIN